MRIESWIDYWNDGFLVYNPDKIRDVFFEYFPEAIFDKTNYSRFHLENFFQIIKEKKYDPPEFIIDSKWKVAFQNGPVFKYEILAEDNVKISVTIKRFRVTFESDSNFEDELELKIIKFLQILKYGVISSDKRTKNFIEQLKDYENYWKLKDN